MDFQVKDGSFLVTGSAGCIGFHVARELLARSARVVGLDNYSDYYSPALKRARGSKLRELANFVSIEGDLAGLEGLFQAHRPARICHLAAQAGVRYSLINPFAYQKANLEGFLTELPFSEDQRVAPPINHGIPRFVKWYLEYHGQP